LALPAAADEPDSAQSNSSEPVTRKKAGDAARLVNVKNPGPAPFASLAARKTRQLPRQTFHGVARVRKPG